MNEVIKNEKHEELSVRFWNNTPVVTFKDIDTVHERPDGTARRAFSKHKKHFLEGTDYYKITPQTLENIDLHAKRTLGIDSVPNRGVTIFTETGYLMLVKSFEDDLSWKVQRYLVNGYFKSERKETDDTKPANYISTTSTSATFIPAPTNWYSKNIRKIEHICKKFKTDKKTLYRNIILKVGEEADIEFAKKAYEKEKGYPPKYALDIISYFDQLSNIATKYLDWLIEWHK